MNDFRNIQTYRYTETADTYVVAPATVAVAALPTVLAAETLYNIYYK